VIAPKSKHIRQTDAKSAEGNFTYGQASRKLPIQNPQTKRSYSSTYGLCCPLRPWLLGISNIVEGTASGKKWRSCWRQLSVVTSEDVVRRIGHLVNNWIMLQAPQDPRSKSIR
jgi:hypothetical protein